MPTKPEIRCTSCKHYLKYNCGCQLPRCRIRASDFIHKGVNCPKYVERKLND